MVTNNCSSFKILIHNSMMLSARIFCFAYLFGLIVAEIIEDCTDLARDEGLLVFSSLGGGLTGIDPLTGEIRWSIDDDPPVKASQTDQPPRRYLPNPKDGSIYQLGNGGDLKKLPYTIPELVANAPCRSSDGILYSGKKSDTWFLIDPKTGLREEVMGFGSNSNLNEETIGWATSRSVYLGRTQYTILMYDRDSKIKNVKPWNITFYDYASHTMAPEISQNYEYIHLTGSSDGLVVTLDRKKGTFLWQKDLISPIIAAFLLRPEGLLSVPFTTVSDETLRSILEDVKNGGMGDVKLYNTLYIGENPFGLYALPSLVDKQVPILSSDSPYQLISGPEYQKQSLRENLVHLGSIDPNILLLGHYQSPVKNKDISLGITPSKLKYLDNRQLATISEFRVEKKNDFILIKNIDRNSIGVQTDEEISNFNNSKMSYNFNSTFLDQKRIKQFLNDSKAWLTDEQSGSTHQILLLLIILVVGMFWYTCSSVRELKQQSQNGSQSNRINGNTTDSYQETIDLGDGLVQIGKIIFNSNEILGKGCEGTFVFKGTFEERKVAVKRLLPESFSLADREVALLKESDTHENVVRYFCTEQDRQFRYIALELCAATLQDYTESTISEKLKSQISCWEVLRQATKGLLHLHSLSIVHRDIKPQNVLISLPDINGSVKVMISDFGLCKKLYYGRASFSRRSGIMGTEGWIAPEMIKGQRTTTSVDIFSLGCVFYYVLTSGQHIFGDALKRQANILSNEYKLDALLDKENLDSKDILAQELISDMIKNDSTKRPSAFAISNHPLFWNNAKILAFLQDVSDRVEKLSYDTEPLKTLEKNGRVIVREDWSMHIIKEIAEDLKKYRFYNGYSVRDLLRALRNKKHHYHELPPNIQELLGNIPTEFTNYWISKFPKLLSHAYHAFSMCAEEKVFATYYDKKYSFTKPQYFDELTQDFVFDNSRKIVKRSPKLIKINKSKRGAYNFIKIRKENDFERLANSDFNDNKMFVFNNELKANENNNQNRKRVV